MTVIGWMRCCLYLLVLTVTLDIIQGLRYHTSQSYDGSRPARTSSSSSSYSKRGGGTGRLISSTNDLLAGVVTSPEVSKRVMGFFRCYGWGPGCTGSSHRPGGRGTRIKSSPSSSLSTSSQSAPHSSTSAGEGGGGGGGHRGSTRRYRYKFQPFFTVSSGGWGPGKRSAELGYDSLTDADNEPVDLYGGADEQYKVWLPDSGTAISVPPVDHQQQGHKYDSGLMDEYDRKLNVLHRAIARLYDLHVDERGNSLQSHELVDAQPVPYVTKGKTGQPENDVTSLYDQYTTTKRRSEKESQQNGDTRDRVDAVTRSLTRRRNSGGSGGRDFINRR